MRWTRQFVVAVPFALALAGAHASAGPLQSAELRVSPAGLSPLVFPATGAVGLASGPDAFALEAGAAFAGVASAAVPSVFITGLRVAVASNQARQFVGSPLGGSCTFTGRLDVLAAGFTFASFPIGFGLSADYTSMGLAATGGTPITIAVHAGRFTTGTVGTPPFTAMGSNAYSTSSGGPVRLVAPLLVQSVGLGDFPMPVTLELVFAPAPEPAALLLLGVGAAVFGLAAPARRR